MQVHTTRRLRHKTTTQGMTSILFISTFKKKNSGVRTRAVRGHAVARPRISLFWDLSACSP
jgi:hypothetical protein